MEKEACAHTGLLESGSSGGPEPPGVGFLLTSGHLLAG